MTKHLALWRERVFDLIDINSRIIEMEGECHQNLKKLLLEFLRKRHDLFVGLRDLLDPAVDALDSTGMLSSMGDVNKRLEQAFLHFQPGKKRSRIMSLVSSSESVDVPALGALPSLPTVEREVLTKSRNVKSYFFAKCQIADSLESCLAIITRQNFLHVYSLPADESSTNLPSAAEEQEGAIDAALKANSPIHSVPLAMCRFDVAGRSVAISAFTEDSAGMEQNEKTEESRFALQFETAEDASEWTSDAQRPFSSESKKEESIVVRI